MQSSPKQIKWWQLPKGRGQLRRALKDLDANLTQPVNEIWMSITRVITSAAADTLGKTKPGNKCIEWEIWW